MALFYSLLCSLNRHKKSQVMYLKIVELYLKTTMKNKRIHRKRRNKNITIRHFFHFCSVFFLLLFIFFVEASFTFEHKVVLTVDTWSDYTQGKIKSICELKALKMWINVISFSVVTLYSCEHFPLICNFIHIHTLSILFYSITYI